MTINLIIIYAPNMDSPLFFSKLQDLIQDNDADYCVICGDFNLVLNPVMDTYGYKHINNPKARLSTLKIMEDFRDIWFSRYLQTPTHKCPSHHLKEEKASTASQIGLLPHIGNPRRHNRQL